MIDAIIASLIIIAITLMGIAVRLARRQLSRKRRPSLARHASKDGT